MSTVNRMRVVWGGSPVVGGGVSTFYFSPGATGFPADMLTFFNAIKAVFQTTVTWTIPNTGDQLEDTTGGLAGVWVSSGGGTTAGTVSTGGTPGGSGVRVRWLTSGMTRGRRVVGTTFFVPVNGGQWNSDGTPSSGMAALFTSAATALIAAQPTLRILTRESAPGLADGHSSPVIASAFPLRASSLRSRRV